MEIQILEKLGCFKWCALQACNCQIRTVSGGDVAESHGHSEARNATPGLGRSTSPSGEAAGEGANHRTDKTPVGTELAQGTTVFHLPLPLEARPIAKRLTINLGPKVSMCLGLATGGLVVENPDG